MGVYMAKKQPKNLLDMDITPPNIDILFDKPNKKTPLNKIEAEDFGPMQAGATTRQALDKIWDFTKKSKNKLAQINKQESFADRIAKNNRITPFINDVKKKLENIKTKEAGKKAVETQTNGVLNGEMIASLDKCSSDKLIYSSKLESLEKQLLKHGMNGREVEKIKSLKDGERMCLDDTYIIQRKKDMVNIHQKDSYPVSDINFTKWFGGKVVIGRVG